MGKAGPNRSSGNFTGIFDGQIGQARLGVQISASDLEVRVPLVQVSATPVCAVVIERLPSGEGARQAIGKQWVDWLG
jgi:hypothetical protein